MASVFLSSTSRDLMDYREAAIEVCNRLSLVPVTTEFFGAMGLGATKASKKRLDQADVYVGIFAHRYGYIEDGYLKSVTEIEFDYAEERGLIRLCFLVEPSYPWPPDLFDFENAEKLRAFRARIDRSLVRSLFTTVDSLKAELMHALIEWRGDLSAENMVAPYSLTATTPSRPALIVGREKEISEIKTRLGVRTIDHRRNITVIRGWPGVGKTTLINTLTYDKEVLTEFPDGILWAVLGPDAKPASNLSAWARQLGLLHSNQSLTLEEAIVRVRPALQQRECLLIVDDAFWAEDAVPFKHVAGAKCCLLVTTRFPEVSQQLVDFPDDDVYVLQVLSDDSAIALLRRLAPRIVQDLPGESLTLVRDLEGLPLAIRVAARLLASDAVLGIDIKPLLRELRASHRLLDSVAPDDRFDPLTGTTPTVELLLTRSTDSLDELTRKRFAMLGAFAPKPATFDMDAMGFVWREDDPLPTVRKLVDRGILEPIISRGRFQMHAILVLHAQNLLERREDPGT